VMSFSAAGGRIEMRHSLRRWGLACIGVGLAVFTAVVVLWASGVWGPSAWAADGGCGGAFRPGEGEGMGGTTAERAFLEQMVPHHADAVAMAELALVRAEHPELRELAETIVRDQTREIEQMDAWYRSWFGVELPPEADGAPIPGRWGRVMGMRGHVDLDVLEAAPVFDREFIEQMVPHHQMGVMMARMVLSRTEHPGLEALARSIIATQSGEIEQMTDWYRQWYE